MFLNKFSRVRGLGRYACLGTAVLETLGRNYKMHNMQKGRIDYQLQVLQNSSRACKPDQVIQHLAREYIAPTIEQQVRLCPDFTPELIFVDSFAELTDQIFRHKTKGWQFCSNWSDITHSDEFNNDFECLGLLGLDGLQEVYKKLLQTISLRWPGISIIYLHFPDVLEARENFVMRAREIRSAVEACALEYPNLYSLSVPSEIVKPPNLVEPGLENFPYHYSQTTYEAFAEMILQHPILRRYF